ncbi:hypothetical protein B0J12DRAFT_740057 [Macrophomina phaseolina]|uniref:Dolichyldiphosphatase n=1 Tax=Macrophomina phaseolina TaxID=35725 RepID=A0ABQ8GBL8_9PEZI|nr:hypothetical protein B0J12DRAFT_740057 [Macrophomina phaseolina]
MEEPALASLSLTHVHYNPHDRFSYLCAWLALVPQGLCVVYATLIWSSREAEVALMFAGQMACEALNWGLKRLIKEERPRQMYGKGYGMPSSHAQFVSFFSLYLALFLLYRHAPHPTHTHTPTTFAQRLALSVLALGAAAAVAFSRIYLSYHTSKQVLVGCAAGAAFAVVWFGVTGWVRSSGLLKWALDTGLARALRARDLVVEEDLVDAGWARWEERRGKRGLGDATKKRRHGLLPYGINLRRLSQRYEAPGRPIWKQFSPLSAAPGLFTNILSIKNSIFATKEEKEIQEPHSVIVAPPNTANSVGASATATLTTSTLYPDIIGDICTIVCNLTKLQNDTNKN